MYRQALFPEPLLLHGEAPRLAGGNGCRTGRVRAVGYAGPRGYGPRSRAISTSRSHAGCAAEPARAALSIALRGWDAQPADPEDALEQRRTRYVLRAGLLPLLAESCSALATAPLRFLSALGLALRLGWRAERPLAYRPRAWPPRASGSNSSWPATEKCAAKLKR